MKREEAEQLDSMTLTLGREPEVCQKRQKPAPRKRGYVLVHSDPLDNTELPPPAPHGRFCQANQNPKQSREKNTKRKWCWEEKVAEKKQPRGGVAVRVLNWAEWRRATEKRGRWGKRGSRLEGENQGSLKRELRRRKRQPEREKEDV